MARMIVESLVMTEHRFCVRGFWWDPDTQDQYYPHQMVVMEPRLRTKAFYPGYTDDDIRAYAHMELEYRFPGVQILTQTEYRTLHSQLGEKRFNRWLEDQKSQRLFRRDIPAIGTVFNFYRPPLWNETTFVTRIYNPNEIPVEVPVGQSMTEHIVIPPATYLVNQTFSPRPDVWAKWRYDGFRLQQPTWWFEYKGSSDGYTLVQTGEVAVRCPTPEHM